MKKNKRIDIFKNVFPFIKNDKCLYYLLAGFKVVLLTLSLLTPIFYKILIEDVIIDKNLNMLIWVVVGYVGAFLIETLTITLNKKVYNTLFLKLKINLKQKLFRKYSKMAYADNIKYDVGDLENRSDADINAIETFLNLHILDYIYAMLSGIIIAIILIFMNWQLAMFGFIMVPLSFVFAKFMSKKAGKVANEFRDHLGKYKTYLHNTLQNWIDIKSNNLNHNEDEIITKHWDVLTPLFIKRQVFWYLNRTFISFKDEFITKMNLYFFGGLLIISGRLEVAILLVFMKYYENFFKNISVLTDAVVTLKTDEPNIDRVLKIVNIKDDPKPKVNIIDGNIKINDVSFKYNDEQGLVLKNINMLIHDTEHIAIVGRSGCGKTTLARIILGLYYPITGNVAVGDFNITQISSESLNKKISIVMQNPTLLNLSFKDNLLLAKKNATKEQIEDACKKANIYDFINSLPDGFDTLIGEKGIKLSGGQKQRVVIARTFLYNPDIIIFDEATSSLDSESEKAIIDAIEELSKNKTLITIAHRLSSVINVDRVYVMDNGEIVANGAHDELKGKNEVYDMMFKGQYNVV